MPVPRKMTLVKLDPEMAEIYQDHFGKDKVFVYLGEIVNMRGHGVFVGRQTGKVYSCYHPDSFVELTEDEI